MLGMDGMDVHNYKLFIMTHAVAAIQNFAMDPMTDCSGSVALVMTRW